MTESRADPPASASVRLIPCALVPPDALYEVLNLGGGAAFWRTRGRTVSLEVFQQLLLGEDEATFGVVDTGADGRVVGHIGLYNCDRISGVASVAAFFDQRLASAELIAATAIREFLDYVFDVIGLRKIHVEMPVANLGTLRQIVERLGVARIEGTFEAHTKIGPDYHDMQQLAVWAEDYQRFRAGRPAATASEISEEDPFSGLCQALAEMGYGPAEAIFGGSRLVDDLGMDSLAIMETLNWIEQTTGRDLESAELSPQVCVQHLVELIDTRPERPWAVR